MLSSFRTSGAISTRAVSLELTAKLCTLSPEVVLNVTETDTAGWLTSRQATTSIQPTMLVESKRCKGGRKKSYPHVLETAEHSKGIVRTSQLPGDRESQSRKSMK